MIARLWWIMVYDCSVVSLHVRCFHLTITMCSTAHAPFGLDLHSVFLIPKGLCVWFIAWITASGSFFLSRLNNAYWGDLPKCVCELVTHLQMCVYVVGSLRVRFVWASWQLLSVKSQQKLKQISNFSRSFRKVGSSENLSLYEKLKKSIL